MGTSASGGSEKISSETPLTWLLGLWSHLSGIKASTGLPSKEMREEEVSTVEGKSLFLRTRLQDGITLESPDVVSLQGGHSPTPPPQLITDTQANSGKVLTLQQRNGLFKGSPD